MKKYTSPSDENRERYAVTAMAAYEMLYHLFKEKHEAGIDPEGSEEHMTHAFEIHWAIKHKIPDPDINFTMHVLCNLKLFDVKRDNSPVDMPPIKGLGIRGCKMPVHLYGIQFQKVRLSDQDRDALRKSGQLEEQEATR